MTLSADTLLAIDTATATASVALYDLATSTLLVESTWQARRRHTQEVLVTAQAMMAQMEKQPSQLRGLAVTTGPGSFTGVRIALSVIKGIAVGLPQPPQVVGIPTLTITAAPWLPLAYAASAQLWVYIQAGRGRYNWAIFDKKLYHPSAADHQAGTAADFAAALRAQSDQSIWLVGEATPDLLNAAAWLRHVTVVDDISALRRAGVLAQLAAQQIVAGQVDDVESLQPLYLQGP
jgi:tRNA threonylcarbamoyladenosine biosynthesis protein TsaB